MTLATKSRLTRIEELSRVIEQETNKTILNLILLQTAIKYAPVGILIYSGTGEKPFRNDKAFELLGELSSLPLSEWKNYGNFEGLNAEKLNGNLASALISGVRSGRLQFKLSKTVDSELQEGSLLRFKIVKVSEEHNDKEKWLGVILYFEGME